jgi:hypothetical protein
MLQLVSRAARDYLVDHKGYEIYRPTHHERAEMRSFWEDWFSRDPTLFAKLYAANRETLKGISSWVDEDSLSASLWRYGVPEQWNTKRQGLGKTGLNEIEQEPTYSDLITFMLDTLGSDVRYLEIGVSVGKNFLQVAERYPEARITGLDVEKPNPVLVRQFDNMKVARTGQTSLVETLSGVPGNVTLAHYELQRSGKSVTYVQGDQFASQTWASLKGERFNFIFSDGVHSARAVKDELEHLLEHDLIDRGCFLMYWDDLVNIEMQSAFVENCDRLAQLFPTAKRGLHWIHGTYGSRRLNGWFSGGVA